MSGFDKQTQSAAIKATVETTRREYPLFVFALKRGLAETAETLVRPAASHAARELS